MITISMSGYVLRQIPGHPMIYATMPDKIVRKLIYSGKLTKESASGIILQIGRPI